MLHWVTAVIDRPADGFGETFDFWTRVTGTQAAVRPDKTTQAVRLLPTVGDSWLKLQRVHGFPGVHLDFEVDDVDATVALATGSGGMLVTRHPAGAVMTSPTGQPFCLVGWRGSAMRPTGVSGPEGATVLDQVCIDVAPSAYDVEVAFYRALTGWDFLHGALPEFDVLRSPTPGPLRLLLQRLDTERGPSAHPDFACSDTEKARLAHQSFGARFAAYGKRWIVMADPAGGQYCLTERDPLTGSLPG